MSARERRSVIATSSTPRSSSRPLSACTSTPGLTPAAGSGGARRPRRRRGAARTRARPAARAASPRPSSARERLARVVRAREQQLAELDDPAAPEPRQVDDAGERVERLRGADVRGRLLAADVLLARLQRQHEAAPPVDVDGLARRCARASAAGTPRARRRSPNDGPPKSRRLPSGWPSPTRDVDAALAGRPQHAERDRVDLADRRPARPRPRPPAAWRPR